VTGSFSGEHPARAKQSKARATDNSGESGRFLKPLMTGLGTEPGMFFSLVSVRLTETCQKM